MSELGMSVAALPDEFTRRKSVSWWGLLCLIATETTLFIYLLFSYAYLGSQSPTSWPPGGPPRLLLAAADTAILLASSFVMAWGVRAFERRRDNRALQIALAGTLIMGVIFVVVQGFEWSNKPFKFESNSYSAIYFTMTGIHLAHVAVGLIVIAALLIWSLTGRLDAGHQHLRFGALYWHFVDAVWIVVFTVLYLIPRLS